MGMIALSNEFSNCSIGRTSRICDEICWEQSVVEIVTQFVDTTCSSVLLQYLLKSCQSTSVMYVRSDNSEHFLDGFDHNFPMNPVREW